MKQWLKKNKIRIILSAVLTLLPMLYGILLWDKLPDSFTTHWGADGTADATGSKAFAVFGIPIIFLVVNLLCVFCTYFDKKNWEKNQKAMGLLFWIMPILSIIINCAVYKTSSSDATNLFWLFPVMFGGLFIAMGNYLPKLDYVKNYKLSTENARKINRFCGFTMGF